MLDYTIQESELHKGFAEEIKINVLQPLNIMLTNLREEKKSWISSIESVKKNLSMLQEKQDLEEILIRSTNLWVDEMQERRRKLIENKANSNNDKAEDISENIIRLEKSIANKIKRVKEINENWEVLIKTIQDKKDKLKEIISQIEETEYSRIITIKQILVISNNIYLKGMNRLATLCGSIMKSYSRIDATQDIQSFINRQSFRSANEGELAELYKITNRLSYIKPESTRSNIRRESTIKREILALKNYCISASKQELKLYPNKALIKNVKLHSDLTIEEPKSIALFLYTACRFCRFTSRNSLLKRESILSRTKIKNEVKETASIENLIIKYWKLDEDQVEYAESVLDSIERLDSFAIYTSSLYAFLILLLKHLIQTLTSPNEKNEISKEFYKEVYSIAWGYIYWQIYKKTNYKDDDFEIECLNIIKTLEFNSYMTSDNLITNIQFANYTLSTLKLLQDKKYSTKVAIPFTLWLFKFYLAPAFFTNENLIDNQIFVNAGPLCLMLGLKIEWEYMIFLRCIMDLYVEGGNYAVKDEKQIKGLKAILGIKKLIDPSFISGLKVNDELKITPAIYEKYDTASILLPICDSFKASLSDFKNNFGNCLNKLRLILELTNFLYVP